MLLCGVHRKRLERVVGDVELGTRSVEGTEVWAGKLLTVREVAQWLRVHEKTVYEWAEKRKLPTIRLGKRLRFEVDDITRWLASRKVT